MRQIPGTGLFMRGDPSKMEPPNERDRLAFEVQRRLMRGVPKEEAYREFNAFLRKHGLQEVK